MASIAPLATGGDGATLPAVPGRPARRHRRPALARHMVIESEVVVRRPVADAWAFLADPANAPRWDRSVARATLVTPGAVGVGSVVETTAPSGKRQRFRVTEYRPERRLAFVLLRSSLFRRAALRFDLDATADGTRIRHRIDVRLRAHAAPLWPVLWLTRRPALAADLACLRRVLEERR